MQKKSLKLKQIASHSPSCGEILSLAACGKIALFTSDGEVIQLDPDTGDTKLLFNTEDAVGYPDGGFDLCKAIDIHTMGDMTAVVNRFGCHGYVYSESGDWRMHIQRGDYRANITRYPLAFYRNDNGDVHMIFGVDWNHLQIANMKTRQVLTAAKSLIEEGEEENHLDYYKTHEEHNKLLWPTEYDYFYGKIVPSPDRKHFMSCGWFWGPFSALTVYETEDFITNPRIRKKVTIVNDKMINYACFIENDAIAVMCEPYPDGEDYIYDYCSSWRIEMYDLEGNQIGVIPVEWELSNAEICFDSHSGCLCLWSEKFGFAAIRPSGEILLHDDSFSPTCYDEENARFITLSDGTVGVWELT